MKIMVTGITGLFGSNLARALVPIGEVHGLKRNESKPDLVSDLASKIIWHEGDLNDYQSLEDAFSGMDLVVHAGGMVSYDPRDKGKLVKVNVEGTTNVVNVMLQLGVEKLLHISSVSALGASPGVALINEEHKWVASPLTTPYGISKYLAELEVWRGAQEGLKVMIFNPAVLLGRIADQRSSTRLYDYVLQGNKFYPRGNINYLDVRDAAEILVRIYKSGQWNQRYILSRESIPYRVFFEKMARAFQKKAPSIPVPAGLMGMLLLGVKTYNLLSPQKIPLNKQTMRIAQNRITFDNRKAEALTGFEYTSLESTLAWALGN